MQVMLHLQADTARMLRCRSSAAAATSELLSRAQKLGVTLRPMRSPSADSVLASDFTVEVPDRATAERIIDELRGCEAVEAAYFVPSDELP